MTYPELTIQPLDYAGVHNMRCLGGHPAAGGAQTRADAIWRGCALQDVSQADRDDMIGRGMVRIIDLRRDDEIAHAPNPLAGDARVEYMNIAVFDGLAPVDDMAKEAPGDFDMGFRYRRALDECQDNIARVLRAVAEAPEGIVYFHCTAGKDRTGLIAALLLSNAGVAREQVVAEYALTTRLGASLMDVLRVAIMARTNDAKRVEQVLASPPQIMAETLAHLDENYGGPVDYLRKIGLTDAERGVLAARLLG